MEISPKMITGSGAVGSPFKNPIKSGKAKNPLRTKNKKDSLLRVSNSENEVAPITVKMTPTTTSPTTNAKVSNMVTASGDGSLPKASLININLNSGENKERNKGMP